MGKDGTDDIEKVKMTPEEVLLEQLEQVSCCP
jgi:hypothetical protein